MGLTQKIWGQIGSWSSSVLQVVSGGTGASTLADGGIVCGNGTSAVEVVAPGTTSQILVGGGDGTNPVWTTATGTGAPVRATSPTLVTPALGTPASGTLTNCTGLPAAGVTGTAAVVANTIGGDGTAGRKIRVLNAIIANGTSGVSLKVTLQNKFNSNAIAAEDNLAKGADTTSYTLSADGYSLAIKATALTGTLLEVMNAHVATNASGTAATPYVLVTGGTLRIQLYNAATGAALDLTTLADSGEIYVWVTYLTST